MILPILRKCAYFTLFFSVLCAYTATAKEPDRPAKKKHAAGWKPVKKPNGSKKKSKKKRLVPDNKEAQRNHETLINTRISRLVCEDMPFADLFETFIRGTLHRNGSNVNIGCLFGVVGSERYQQHMSKKLTLELDDISIAELLHILRRQIGIGYDVSSYGVVIDASGVAPLIPGKHTDKIEENRDFLTSTRIPTLDAEALSLADMLAYIRHTIRKKGSTINIIPIFGEPGSEQHKQFMSKKLTLKLNDISLSELFDILSRQVGIDYTIVPYGVIISPARKPSSR